MHFGQPLVLVGREDFLDFGPDFFLQLVELLVLCVGQFQLVAKEGGK